MRERERETGAWRVGGVEGRQYQQQQQQTQAVVTIDRAGEHQIPSLAALLSPRLPSASLQCVFSGVEINVHTPTPTHTCLHRGGGLSVL